MMLRDKCKLLTVFLLVFGGLIAIGQLQSTETDEKEPNSPVIERTGKAPMVIWFHSGLVNSPQTLKTAISSGLINHVLLLYTHRADHDWKKSKRVLEAIQIVKESDAKLIWCRDLWPYWNLKNFKTESMFDPNYYVQEIRHLRAEAEEMGADFVCLDTEPYGYSPMKTYLLVGKHHVKLNKKQVAKLKSAIKEAIAKVGKIDFILQAGWVYYEDHPFEIIAQLAENRVSACTYRVNESVFKAIKYPYEIFGAHLNTTRECEGRAPYFLVSDIFERSHYWSSKKGVYLYTMKENSLPVAKALVDYAKNLPVLNPEVSGEPNALNGN